MYAAKKRDAEAHREWELVGAMTTAPPRLRGQALRALAAVDQMHGLAEQASAEMLQAIQVSGEQPGDSLMAGSLALGAKDNAAAERELVKALAADPENLNARVALGTALARNGKLTEAQETLEVGLKTNPNDVRLVTTLAEAYSVNGKDAEALGVLEGLWKRDETVHGNVLVDRMLARLYTMNGRPADAEPLLRELAAETNKDPRALDDLGSALVKEAKYGEAVQVLATAVGRREAFHDDKAWAEAASHLAFAASRNKQPEIVLQALAARATVLPNSPTSLFLAATANDSLHHYKDASRLYKEFLAVSGGKFPDEEFEARHRLVALQHER
jgi:predicted Zn-dependent protease